MWFYLWRYPVWSIDDLYFVTRDGFSWGGTSFTYLWNDLLNDVGERNGRTGDLALQIIYALTTQLWLVFALISVGFSLATYLFLRAHTGSKEPWTLGSVSQVLAVMVSVAIFFVISAFTPSIPGTMIMFMAAVVAYLGGFILFVTSTLLYRSLATAITAPKTADPFDC